MKLTKIKLEEIIKDEIHEVFNLPKFKKLEISAADGLRTLASGLDTAFEEISALKQRIAQLEDTKWK